MSGYVLIGFIIGTIIFRIIKIRKMPVKIEGKTEVCYGCGERYYLYYDDSDKVSLMCKKCACAVEKCLRGEDYLREEKPKVLRDCACKDVKRVIYPDKSSGWRVRVASERVTRYFDEHGKFIYEVGDRHMFSDGGYLKEKRQWNLKINTST